MGILKSTVVGRFRFAWRCDPSRSKYCCVSSEIRWSMNNFAFSRFLLSEDPVLVEGRGGAFRHVDEFHDVALAGFDGSMQGLHR